MASKLLIPLFAIPAGSVSMVRRAEVVVTDRGIHITKESCDADEHEHPDYPGVCVKSVLKNVDLNCPTNAIVEGSSSAEYPHALMTKNCPKAVLETTCMTKETYDNIDGAIATVINSLDKTCTSSKCPQADWGGCVLRMAGHDFMDFNSTTGKGGSDACTDMNHGDNKGLAPCLHSGEHGSSLVKTYEKFCTTVSLADFLVIAAEAVMKSLGGPVFKDNFKFGRKTTPECPEAAHHLPNPENGCSAVQTTFITNMGLDWKGATALMGVHTLGRAKPENSGYSGWWSDPENSRKFNNDYYKSLRNKGWEPNRAVCGNTKKNQWVMSGSPNTPHNNVKYGEATEMMLDTDMCLAFHIKHGAAGEDCCAWLNRCHGGSGADDREEINWVTKLNKAGENVTNPNDCILNWGTGKNKKGGVTSSGKAAQLTSPEQLCGRRDIADCGMRNQKGDFITTNWETRDGNKCEKKVEPSGREIWHCTTSSSLSGIAHEHVTNFSSDQEAWFDAFLASWSKATSNGFKSLQALKDTCA